MGITNNIAFFFIRKFSSDYKNEIKKLNELSSFSELAMEVKTAQGSSSALLAIQDYAFKACKDRMAALREGRKITLLKDEKAVGSEYCIIGRAECMKEVYIQAKALRHKIDIKSIKATSTTFLQLNLLGILSKTHLLDEQDYNKLPTQIADAYVLGFKNKLSNWIEKAKIDNPRIKEALQLKESLFESYEEGGGGWTDPVEQVSVTYKTLKAAHDFLNSNSTKDGASQADLPPPPPYDEAVSSAPPPPYDKTD